jgi:hypothetical protein
MKDCKKIHPLLPFYIEGQLSSTDKDQVDKHLGVCETARIELEHFRHLLEGMRNLPEPQVPADLHGKIMAKLGQNPQSITLRHHFWGPQIWGLAAAVVMVFVLFSQYPNWKDAWRMNKPESPPTSADTFTATTNTPAPKEPGYAKVMPEKPTNMLALKKKQSVDYNATANVQSYGAMTDKKSVDTGKDLGLTKPNVEKDLTSTAEPKARAFAEVEEAPALQRSAKKASRKAESNVAAGAAAPAPMAALPPAAVPPAPSLDQSMRSLTYSQEQTVMTWNGNNGPSTVESQELVTDAETFQKYWQIPHPGEVPPEVDFTKNAVVILSAGEKPSAGYSIHLTRLEEKADQLVIHYKVDTPAPDAVVAAILTHPWVLQVIPKPFKPVVYVRDPQ